MEGRDAPPLARKLCAELAATFFMTLVAAGVDLAFFTTGHVDDVSRWLARGFIAAAVIFAFAEVSGAHGDPAVSLGFAVRGVFPVPRMLMYTAVQFGGGFLASGLLWLEWGSRVLVGASHPGEGVSAVVATAVEIVLTYILMTVILATAGAEPAISKQAAIAVGFTVAACGFAGGQISGASMNPARSIPALIVGGNGAIAWIYLIGPSVGAVLAALTASALLGRPSAPERDAAQGSDSTRAVRSQ